MTKTYGAINPQQIIDLFEMRAKIAGGAANHATTQKDNALHTREAATWRTAADILRNTEFVGWTHDSRIVDDISLDDQIREEIFGDPKDRGGTE